MSLAGGEPGMSRSACCVPERRWLTVLLMPFTRAFAVLLFFFLAFLAKQLRVLAAHAG